MKHRNFREYCQNRRNRLFEGAADGFESLIQGDQKNMDLRALRIAMMAEIEAVNVYERLAEMVKNPKVKEVLLDVAKEEKVHVGEFQKMIDTLDKEYEDSIKDGEEEVEKM